MGGGMGGGEEGEGGWRIVAGAEGTGAGDFKGTSRGLQGELKGLIVVGVGKRVCKGL